jgi:hypothetical protein
MPWPRNAFVKLVDADWELSSPDDAEQQDGFGGSETLYPIDGCTKKTLAECVSRRLWLTQTFTTIGAAIQISGQFSTNGFLRFLGVKLCREKDCTACLEWCHFRNMRRFLKRL